MATLNNVNPSKDVYLADNQAAPPPNLDTFDLHVGRDTTFAAIRRSLLSFDISAIPSGSTIDSATLNLNVIAGAGVSRTCDIHPMTVKSWVETEAWWNDYSSGNAWSAAGGDYNGGSTVSFSGPTTTGNLAITVTTLVQNALSDGDFNIIIKQSNETLTGSQIWEFDDRHAGTAPDLDITYTEPAGGDNRAVMRGAMRGVARGVMGLAGAIALPAMTMKQMQQLRAA